MHCLTLRVTAWHRIIPCLLLTGTILATSQIASLPGVNTALYSPRWWQDFLLIKPWASGVITALVPHPAVPSPPLLQGL